MPREDQWVQIRENKNIVRGMFLHFVMISRLAEAKYIVGFKKNCPSVKT